MTKEEIINAEIEFTDWWFANHKKRPTYADAIEWERKRMIDKACEVLRYEIFESFDDDGHPIVESIRNVTKLCFMEDFRKSMENIHK